MHGLVPDFDAAHHDAAADVHALGLLFRRVCLLVVIAAKNRLNLADHCPVFRDPVFYSTKQRKHVYYGLVGWRDGGAAKVDLTATQDRLCFTPTKVLRIDAAFDATQDRSG